MLGVLIEHPEPLRLADVGTHPRSYGFPAGHPVMRSFLGVPVVVRGEAWGNLYLTEKEGGEFSERDEQAAVILADWAAVAINNARLYETSELRRHELEKAVRGLEATRDVAVAIGGEIALEHVLELIAKRGRALVGARSLVIMLREGDELVVHASAGHVAGASWRAPADLRVPPPGRCSNAAAPERITDVDARLGIAPAQLRRRGRAARRCSCRCSTAAKPSVCSPPSIAARTARLQRGARADAAHLRGERRDRGRARAERARRSTARLASRGR